MTARLDDKDAGQQPISQDNAEIKFKVEGADCVVKLQKGQMSVIVNGMGIEMSTTSKPPSKVTEIFASSKEDPKLGLLKPVEGAKLELVSKNEQASNSRGYCCANGVKEEGELIGSIRKQCYLWSEEVFME
eukprot:CAMPEP_0169166088 /NCGR_PEP_ID=MMETSP1015-20121227/59757_1 /TAXON_ID=342587 /ORGANISM="Karlodinium micrum, Strain CCMP2283" /LENGTH=130 /DNA_ID=CAMNT_0009238719 /DNA_START=177 /DNA_END=569 /DNA_ORIENTATION=+